jgi:hypothetical protein
MDQLFCLICLAMPLCALEGKGRFSFLSRPTQAPPCAAGDFFTGTCTAPQAIFFRRGRSCALLLLLLLLAASASCWLLAAASASAWPARERTKIATLCWQEVIKTSHALKGAPASTSWLVVGFVL